jgi:Tol biopolymer transport system component
LKLFPSRDPNHIYWYAGICVERICSVSANLVSTADGSSTNSIPFAGEPAFAVDGRMAFMSRDKKGVNQLTLVNGDQTRVIPFYGNRLVHMEWSPDGSTLAVSVSLVSDYSGLVLRSRLYFVTWPYSMDLIEDLPDETIVGHAWSPDGKSLLVIKRKFDGTQYHLGFSVLDSFTQQETPAFGFDLVSKEYLSLQPVFWIP